MRRRLLFAALYLSLLGSTGPSHAQELGADPALATIMDGGYVLASVTGGRECRFRLSAERNEGEFRLVLPYTCRTAFPLLRPAISWTLGKDGEVVLLDQKNATTAIFMVTAPNLLEMRDANGSALIQMTGEKPGWYARRSELLQQAAAPEQKEAAPASNAAPVGTEPAAAPAQPAPLPSTPKDLEGWYTVLRAGGKPSGCRLALLSAETAQAGTKAAALDEKCKDGGLKIFKPVAWRLEGDTLILTARRGHELAMKRTAKGSWTKAVASGEELVLERFQ